MHIASQAIITPITELYEPELEPDTHEKLGIWKTTPASCNRLFDIMQAFDSFEPGLLRTARMSHSRQLVKARASTTKQFELKNDMHSKSLWMSRSNGRHVDLKSDGSSEIRKFWTIRMYLDAIIEKSMIEDITAVQVNVFMSSEGQPQTYLIKCKA